MQTFLEARVLDGEIRRDDLQLVLEGNQLVGARAKHGAQQFSQPIERAERTFRRGLNEVTNGGERIEQEVRIQLRPERAELGFGGKAQDLLLSGLALVTLTRDADRVDAACCGRAHVIEQGDVIREETPAGSEPRNIDEETWRLCGRHSHYGGTAMVNE